MIYKIYALIISFRSST